MQKAEFNRLDDRQHYQGQLPDQEGRYYSQTLAAFWLKPDWLWLTLCLAVPRLSKHSVLRPTSLVPMHYVPRISFLRAAKAF
ncbi:MAG TPA: hypothetical protein VH186_35665 [Chloroflexia bacterium]|nr:hypothetical protein [Chloroflexia bacterium]